jgi:uncharacterized protein (DUF2384 family)
LNVPVRWETLRGSTAGRGKPMKSVNADLHREQLVLALAERALGCRQAAVTWLHTSNLALDDQVPARLLKSNDGLEAVQRALVALAGASSEVAR